MNSGIAIAYAALDYILRHNKSKTLFATHYHELYDMLTTTTPNGDGQRTTRPGVEFWCTDVDEVVRRVRGSSAKSLEADVFPSNRTADSHIRID